MLLEDKVAVIYGGGGAIGGAVAHVFAREGARVFLAGRTAAALEPVAGQIRAGGGVADTAGLDALDEQAVDQHADAVVAAAGSLEISFDLISPPYDHRGEHQHQRRHVPGLSLGVREHQRRHVPGLTASGEGTRGFFLALSP